MIVWINGAFGAGKTSTARELIDLIPNSTFYDPEVIGGALRHLLPQKLLAQVERLPGPADLAASGGGRRRRAARRGRRRTRGADDAAAPGVPGRDLRWARGPPHPGTACAPHSGGNDPAGADSGPRGVPRRPGGREQRVRKWAYEHIEPFRRALGWLAADAHPSTTVRSPPRESAERIAEAVRSGAARACEIVQTPEPTAETLAAGVLLFDEQDRVLLVDPTYKPGWEFPGGVVERGEAPARAGIREVEEETGRPARPRTPPPGGRLGAAEASRLRRPAAALRRRPARQRAGRAGAAARRRTARLALRQRGGGGGTAAARPLRAAALGAAGAGSGQPCSIWRPESRSADLCRIRASLEVPAWGTARAETSAALGFMTRRGGGNPVVCRYAESAELL